MWLIFKCGCWLSFKLKVTDLGDFGLVDVWWICFKFDERLLIDEFGLFSIFDELVDDDWYDDGEDKVKRSFWFIDGELVEVKFVRDFESNFLIELVDWICSSSSSSFHWNLFSSILINLF